MSMTAGEFEGRVVVVTGGKGALGEAVVDALRAQGAEVAIPSREDGVDLTDEAAVTKYYAALPSLWASVHVAGGFAMSPVLETTGAKWDEMMNMNARSCFLCCREAVRAMRRSSSSSSGGGGGGRRAGGSGGGGATGGRIVNVGSQAGATPSGGMLAYAVSKAAVHALTVALAAETKEEGIFVNAVLPTIIDTPANRKQMPNADHSRWPRPAEIAAIMVSLASPRNVVTSGALVPVHGRS